MFGIKQIKHDIENLFTISEKVSKRSDELLEKLQKICKHETCKYKEGFNYSGNWSIYNPTTNTYAGSIYEPNRCDYNKTCDICGVVINITKEEYDEFIKQKELKQAYEILNKYKKGKK